MPGQDVKCQDQESWMGKGAEWKADPDLVEDPAQKAMQHVQQRTSLP